MRKNKTIAILTIGQAPRKDLEQTLNNIFINQEHIIQYGALDELAEAEINSLRPETDKEERLVTRLKNGKQVVIKAHSVHQQLAKLIQKCEVQSVDLIVLACTGNFPAFASSIPIIYPDSLSFHWVSAIFSNPKIAVIMPDSLQKPMIRNKWNALTDNIHSFALSPYKWDTCIAQGIARSIQSLNVDLVILDCIGYSEQMKEELQSFIKVPILLPRTLALSAPLFL